MQASMRWFQKAGTPAPFVPDCFGAGPDQKPSRSRAGAERLSINSRRSPYAHLT
ncbi:MAG: hypothetical protein MJZ89_01970 [Paludibacteraceae bacterium]|nr:hypothetical protein [Paludibacteraceae bacterium]